MPSPTDAQSHSEYCSQQVRRYDYFRYFAAMFAAGEARRGLIALYAFNLEIASVRERVSEALLGQMRLQWWRDTIEEIFAGTTRNHSVVSELAWAITAFELPQNGLERLIEGRMFDLEDQPPEDSGALTLYASATSGQLAALAASICGQPDSASSADALGTSWGMTGLLRALPYQAAQRRVYLPQDILRTANLTIEDVIEHRNPDATKAAVTAFIALIDKPKLEGIWLPRALRPAIAYAALTDRYLRRLKYAGNDVYAENFEISRLSGQIRICRSAITGRI